MRTRASAALIGCSWFHYFAPFEATSEQRFLRQSVYILFSPTLALIFTVQQRFISHPLYALRLNAHLIARHLLFDESTPCCFL